MRLKCDGTRAETRFGLSAKRTSPFKSARASVQSTAASRGVRISGSNAGYTKFRGSVKRCEGYWLPTPFASFPFTSPPVRRRVPSHFNWTLLTRLIQSVVADCSTFFSFHISLTLEAMTFGTDDCRCGIRVPDFSTKAVRNPSHFGYPGVGILVQ